MVGVVFVFDVVVNLCCVVLFWYFDVDVCVVLFNVFNYFNGDGYGGGFDVLGNCGVKMFVVFVW